MFVSFFFSALYLPFNEVHKQAGWLAECVVRFSPSPPDINRLERASQECFFLSYGKRGEGGRAGKESEGKRQGESVQAKLKRAPRGAGGTLCTRLPLLGIKKAEISLCVERGWKF
jgi:hypothetical protein